MHKHFEGGNRDAIIATGTSVSASSMIPWFRMPIFGPAVREKLLILRRTGEWGI